MADQSFVLNQKSWYFQPLVSPRAGGLGRDVFPSSDEIQPSALYGWDDENGESVIEVPLSGVANGTKWQFVWKVPQMDDHMYLVREFQIGMSVSLRSNTFTWLSSINSKAWYTPANVAVAHYQSGVFMGNGPTSTTVSPTPFNIGTGADFYGIFWRPPMMPATVYDFAGHNPNRNHTYGITFTKSVPTVPSEKLAVEMRFLAEFYPVEVLRSGAFWRDIARTTPYYAP